MIIISRLWRTYYDSYDIHDEEFKDDRENDNGDNYANNSVDDNYNENDYDDNNVDDFHDDNDNAVPAAADEVAPEFKIKTLHPLKAPRRDTPEGVAICRFHNYDKRGCFKFNDPSCSGESCPYDHALCHICLKDGHRALDCSFGAPLI